MEATPFNFAQLAANSRRFAQRLLTIGENRLELLTVEVQADRERLLHALLLALGMAAFGLLAGLTLTAALVVLLWDYSPVSVLLTLTALSGIAGGTLYQRLKGLRQGWQTLPATLDQLHKDRICLEEFPH